MKLCRFEAESGERIGVVKEDSVVDAGPFSEDAWTDALENGIAEPSGTETPLGSAKLLPPLPGAGVKVFALAWAYASHRDEVGRDPMLFPFFFLKHYQTYVGAGEDIIRPKVSDKFDFEGEFAVVIGKGGRYIPEAEARNHIAGYTILMDGSIRDYQKQSVTAGKNFDDSSSCGPWVVTADEIPDPHGLELRTLLNGTEMQKSETGLLLWSVDYLIHYCSSFSRLNPGDVISTGTPGGVGHKRDPQIFMKPGDEVEIHISNLGVLKNTVRDE